MTRAFAKLNLALVVGPLRTDGKHEIATVLVRLDLHDDIELGRSEQLAVEGFPDDTIVHTALESLARAAGVEPSWRVRIEKRIPVASGLGGGSANAAAAMELANATLVEPLSATELHDLARGIGADVPFFLERSPQLGRGDGTDLQALDLPLDFHALLVIPDGQAKVSTRAVYDAFEARGGGAGFEERVEALEHALEALRAPRDLVGLPRNDLASSPVAEELSKLGAFRADVSGAGPAVYGLFEEWSAADDAQRRLGVRGWTWLARPVT
jgi:4-diphosphocytidyl-2-C-methyl-D-erythritol kinase